MAITPHDAAGVFLEHEVVQESEERLEEDEDEEDDADDGVWVVEEFAAS